MCYFFGFFDNLIDTFKEFDVMSQISVDLSFIFGHFALLIFFRVGKQSFQ